ncbi:MAG: sigma-70 family RNA polymerase sigma factor, partial [Caulobacterales bacterium]|nr:sigma-70 family RNA polymerase sigma factor [Caulobacterales bacterium]
MAAKKPKPGAGRSAIAAVFKANLGLIEAVARRYAIHQIDVADITQETIARALEAERRTVIREPRRFLIGIAKNVARNELERRSRIMLQAIDDSEAQTYVSDEPAVDDVVDARGRIETFWGAVSSLPPQCQKVFVLKHVYGASNKEIA